ncbi:ANTAR domain-containing protein [Actinomadura sp. LD22]|uniref:ANTAR domain-containing protein n=2 Tax=Actinomadura physcomitrii TaxID=2650748 RepID=A0A6I4MWL3_9ACTN|nr:ANTAR domain-containing protein [Actinomadura physcomitrii]
MPPASLGDPVAVAALGAAPDPAPALPDGLPRVPRQQDASGLSTGGPDLPDDAGDIAPDELPSPDAARPEPLAAAASHPDLAEVTDRQLSRGRGPIFDVVMDRRTLSCDDILVEARWPEAVSDMLRRGVRCFTTSPHLNPPVLVTLTLYGVTPKALGPDRLGLVSLLLAQGSARMSNAQQYDDVHRTAAQLQEAVEARAVVDQAKGILMHALGCGADEAFAEMRRISQTRHVKLTALAQRIVGDQGLRQDLR